MSRVEGRKPPHISIEDKLIVALLGGFLQFVELATDDSLGDATDKYGQMLHRMDHRSIPRIVQALRAHLAAGAVTPAVGQIDQVIAAFEQIEREAVS